MSDFNGDKDMEPKATMEEGKAWEGSCKGKPIIETKRVKSD